MSKKFWAKNRVTGAQWKPEQGKKQYLVMYDSGYLAVVTEDFYQYVIPLDAKEWQVGRAELLTKQAKQEPVAYVKYTVGSNPIFAPVIAGRHPTNIEDYLPLYDAPKKETT